MAETYADLDGLDPAVRAFYGETLAALEAGAVPAVVGGAYALAHYTGIVRHTKDFDLFIHPRDYRRALDILTAAGLATELTSPIWIAKAWRGEDFVDLIFGSANGVAVVDDDWFAHARPGTVLDRPVQVCPVEEMIWSKAYVQDRERYDGADVLHLLRACGPALDWARLLQRFDTHWPLLLSYLVLFGFVFPSQVAAIPAEVTRALLDRARGDLTSAAPAPAICRGTLFSRLQYLPDLEASGLADARIEPWGRMTPDQAAELTREETAHKPAPVAAPEAVP